MKDNSKRGKYHYHRWNALLKRKQVNDALVQKYRVLMQNAAQQRDEISAKLEAEWSRITCF